MVATLVMTGVYHLAKTNTYKYQAPELLSHAGDLPLFLQFGAVMP